MKNADLIKESLETIARMIRKREVSPVEVVEAHLERIAELNPELNAIVTLAPDVLERARAAEIAVMRGDSGALLGVPLTIKDTIETAGLRTTSGSKMRMDYVPQTDAPAVARLKGAGAIILGKSNAAEMAMDYTADNPVFGRTNHPLNYDLTPGGSSGGEAVAIATFMSPGGLGSDLAGSVRIPAHFCGVCGLKPTTGRVPGELQFPPSIGPYSLGAVIGPLARSAADLRLLFAALSKDPFERKSHDLRGVRVAWYTDDGVAPVTDETAHAVAAVARSLSDAGLKVEEQRPPHVERGNELWLKVFSRASVVQLRGLYKGRENEGGSFVSWRLGTADHTPAPALDEYIAGWMERDRLREELVQWMETTPIIIAPVGATPAYPHDTLKVTVRDTTMGTFKAFSYAQTFSVFNLPVVTVPAGKSNDGLPIGVQIAGLPFTEEMILAAAEIVETALSTTGGNSEI
ncbi:MAG: amidase [Acidobacteriota bacterium]|jgi:Asp-tRNA(Asn)/Glu-tRNA(Gln) amidotransferase A subunit family amidase